MNWIILLLAGLFEVSLTFCLGKARAASGLVFYLWGSGFLASTVLSMTLLARRFRLYLWERHTPFGRVSGRSARS